MNPHYRKVQLMDNIAAVRSPGEIVRISEASSADIARSVMEIAAAVNEWATDMLRDLKQVSPCNLGTVSFGDGVITAIREDLADPIKAAGERAAEEDAAEAGVRFASRKRAAA